MSIFTKERGNKTNFSKLNMEGMGIERFLISPNEGIVLKINTDKINYEANFAPAVSEVLGDIKRYPDNLYIDLSVSDNVFNLLSSVSHIQSNNTGMMLSVMEADMKRSENLGLDDYESKREAYETATRRIKDDQDMAFQLGVNLIYALNSCYCAGTYEVC